MGDCRNDSETTPFVPRSPRFSSTSVIAGAPFAAVRVFFDTPMDTGVTPAAASFRIVVDGTPIIPTGVAWNTPSSIDLSWGTPNATVSGVVQLITWDANLRSSTGVIMTAPQEIVFFP